GPPQFLWLSSIDIESTLAQQGGHYNTQSQIRPAFIPARNPPRQAPSSSRNFSILVGFNRCRWSGARPLVSPYQQRQFAEDSRAIRIIGEPTDRSDRAANPAIGNQASVSAEVHTYEVEVHPFPPRAIYSFGRRGRARPPLCLW